MDFADVTTGGDLKYAIGESFKNGQEVWIHTETVPDI